MLWSRSSPGTPSGNVTDRSMAVDTTGGRVTEVPPASYHSTTVPQGGRVTFLPRVSVVRVSSTRPRLGPLPFPLWRHPSQSESLKDEPAAVAQAEAPNAV